MHKRQLDTNHREDSATEKREETAADTAEYRTFSSKVMATSVNFAAINFIDFQFLITLSESTPNSGIAPQETVLL